jgi:hypothetical protein
MTNQDDEVVEKSTFFDNLIILIPEIFRKLPDDPSSFLYAKYS